MYKCCKVFFVLTILLSINLISTNYQVEGSTLFPDVKSYRSEIVYLNKQGIVNGYKNGNFGPNDPIKRLQAVQMILKELGVDPKGAPNPHFKDVKPTSYGYNEIAMAAQLGIISGKADGSFDPNGQLTRGQMALILVNAYNLKGAYHSNFKDVKKNDPKYSAIQTLASHNITKGYPDGTFHPNETLKRAHFAAFLARLLNDDFKPKNVTTTSNLSTESLANQAQSVVVIELYDQNNELVSQGSGFIVANQLIATNFHVISGGTRAVAITNDGEEIELEGVVNYDDYLDIAILKPIEKIGFPSLQLSKFNLVKTGEKVVAIGSPYGFKNTISEGIVSGVHTFEDETGSLKAIQTTAEITYGSSGGPLLNMNGLAVGLNSFGFEEINFAISTDYVDGLLTPYKNRVFEEIQTEDFNDMPEIDDEDEEGWDEEVITEELPEPINLESLNGTKQVLSDIFVDVVHDPELPVIYGINEYGELVSVNYETKNIKRLPLSLPAESIFYQNGDLYITLLKGEHSSYWYDETQKGAVAIVDPTTFTIKKLFDINIDPYDIVSDDQYFYVSSGSGQWTFIKSYNKETGIEVSSDSIRQASSIFLHPNKDRIYAVNSDSSPRDMEVFRIQNGVFTGGYDSPYHGDYELLPYMALSPDGKYIFNNEGTVFVASRLESTDMQYVTDLNTWFNDITFNKELSKFYLAIADMIYVYDYENFTPIKTYGLDGDGYYLFNHKGSLVVVGLELSKNSNIPKTFIMKANME
ncbi:S-layer homology domain-containing protein [Ureibacillus sp. NPDC094379]